MVSKKYFFGFITMIFVLVCFTSVIGCKREKESEVLVPEDVIAVGFLDVQSILESNAMDDILKQLDESIEGGAVVMLNRSIAKSGLVLKDIQKLTVFQVQEKTEGYGAITTFIESKKKELHSFLLDQMEGKERYKSKDIFIIPNDNDTKSYVFMHGNRLMSSNLRDICCRVVDVIHGKNSVKENEIIQGALKQLKKADFYGVMMPTEKMLKEYTNNFGPFDDTFEDINRFAIQLGVEESIDILLYCYMEEEQKAKELAGLFSMLLSEPGQLEKTMNVSPMFSNIIVTLFSDMDIETQNTKVKFAMKMSNVQLKKFVALLLAFVFLGGR